MVGISEKDEILGFHPFLIFKPLSRGISFDAFLVISATQLKYLDQIFKPFDSHKVNKTAYPLTIVIQQQLGMQERILHASSQSTMPPKMAVKWKKANNSKLLGLFDQEWNKSPSAMLCPTLNSSMKIDPIKIGIIFPHQSGKSLRTSKLRESLLGKAFHSSQEVHKSNM